MNEKRLMQIQELVNERNIFPNRMYIFREDINDEELELYNEVIRLREENEKLHHQVNMWRNIAEEKVDLPSRIDKAIEYIKVECMCNYGLDDTYMEKLLNILNGRSDE